MFFVQTLCFLRAVLSIKAASFYTTSHSVCSFQSNSNLRNMSVVETQAVQTKLSEYEMIKVKLEDKENIPEHPCSCEKPMFQLFNNSAETVSKKRKRSKAPPGKPPYSYVALVTMAIRSSPYRKMTLAEILKFIYENFPYYRTCPLKWRNAIRHNLTLNDCFVKLPREVHDQNRGHYWTVDSSSEMMFDEGKYRRRKRRFTRQVNVDESPPLLVEQTNIPNYKRIPAQSTILCCPRVPVIAPVAPVIQRRGFTIDEILAPEPNLMNTDIPTVYNPTTHFVNYRLPNSFIPYYPNMYWSYPFSTYSVAKRTLSFSSQDEDDY